MRKKAVAILCLLCALAVPGQEGKQGDRTFGFRLDDHYKALDAVYQEWLNTVAAIASREEISAFLQLPTVRDRDLFIRLFWQQRDPTPGSEANEYRDEIERRFRHVNEFFGRGTPRPGWMTAMGRIYMILGEPASTESFDQEAGIVPTQVWYYSGDPKLGLPPYFNVTFFKAQGIGEWKLYDPGTDGPAALMVNGDQYTSADYSRIYKFFQQQAPNLAGPAFSMIPGQSLVNSAPSLRDSFILANIYRSPVRSVSDAYAANFLKYKGYVSVDSSLNYVENSHVVAIQKDSLWGHNLVAFSVKPKKLTIRQDEASGRMGLSLDLTIALKLGDKDVYSDRRHYELAVEPGQLDIIRSGGVVIHDSFPVVPGSYRLAVFLQNPVSREFCFFEESVRVPESARPRLATPILGFKAEKAASNFFFPYKAGGWRLAVDPDLVFASGRSPQLWLGAYNLDKSIWDNGRIEWEIKGLNEKRPFRQVGGLRLADLPFQRNLNAIEAVAAEPLAAGFYGLSVKLADGGGRVIDSRETTFQISPLPSLAQPSELYSQGLADSPYNMDFIVGQQFRRLGDEEKALYSLEKSLQAKPDFPDARQALLEILLKRGQYERVAREAEQLPRSGEAAFAGHFLKGQALFGLRDFTAALAELLAANAIVNTDVNLINLIGRTCLELDDGEQAARAFTASLALKKNQPEIEKLLLQATAKSGKRGK